MVDITTTDLQNRFEGDISQWSELYLTTQIADAEAFIATMVPASTVRLANGRLSEQMYKRVVADVVFRVLRNPGGFTSEGDGSYNYSRSAVVASGNLWLTANDLKVLTGTTMAVGTIGMRVDRGWA